MLYLKNRTFSNFKTLFLPSKQGNAKVVKTHGNESAQEQVVSQLGVGEDHQQKKNLE